MVGNKCGCKKTASKARECPFPEKELKAWLKGRTYWNHEDWVNLLKKLDEKGYSQWTSCEEGRNQLGQFLESERTKPL